MLGNTLYYGDNLHIMREFIEPESVDLIYLDPPFNSNATYNLLFRTPKGQAVEAQTAAFRDTWWWDTPEVKREDADASHDALLRRYGAQATEYSNTSARIGFLLVLDRSRADGSAGHIEEKVAVRTVRKSGDREDRMLIIIVMPGRRKRPSSMR